MLLPNFTAPFLNGLPVFLKQASTAKRPVPGWSRTTPTTPMLGTRRDTLMVAFPFRTTLRVVCEPSIPWLRFSWPCTRMGDSCVASPGRVRGSFWSGRCRANVLSVHLCRMLFAMHSTPYRCMFISHGASRLRDRTCLELTTGTFSSAGRTPCGYPGGAILPRPPGSPHVASIGGSIHVCTFLRCPRATLGKGERRRLTTVSTTPYSTSCQGRGNSGDECKSACLYRGSAKKHSRPGGWLDPQVRNDETETRYPSRMCG